MNDKQQRRAHVLGQREAKLGMMKVLLREARSLVEALPEEWVCRRTILTQRSGAWGSGPPAGHESYWGTQNPGTRFYREGFLFDNPHEQGVRTCALPDSAKLIAQCAADKDSGFERQAHYKIEVVDRIDGEVYCQIDSRSEYSKALKRGVTDAEGLRAALAKDGL